jgi:hypothetical protein
MTSRVHDALKERLPSGWSLTSADGPSTIDGTHSTYYRWTRWSDGNQMLVEVHEDYAEQAGTVDQLCDRLMDAVYESFNDPWARNTTPLARKATVT